VINTAQVLFISPWGKCCSPTNQRQLTDHSFLTAENLHLSD